MSARAEDALTRLRRDWEPRFRRFVADQPAADPGHGPIHLERVVARLTALLEKYVADGRSTPGEPQENDAKIALRKDGKGGPAGRE